MYRSGLMTLDKQLAPGTGVPPGSIVELVGPSDAGKTALALWFCRTALETEGQAAGWVCAETNLNSHHIAWAGVDPARLVVSRQSPDLPGLRAAQLMVENGAALVVVDSIASLISSDPEQLLQKVLSAGLPPLKGALAEQGAVAILTNQERSHIGGRGTIPSGLGNALLRTVDYRIQLRTGEGLYRAGEQIGVRVYFKIVKNGPDPAAWDRTGKFTCLWTGGLRNLRRAPEVAASDPSEEETYEDTEGV